VARAVRFLSVASVVGELGSIGGHTSHRRINFRLPPTPSGLWPPARTAAPHFSLLVLQSARRLAVCSLQVTDRYRLPFANR